MRLVPSTSLVLLALVGCKGDGPAHEDSGPGTGAGNGVMQASCAVQDDNVLRYDCTVTSGAAGPIEVSWTPVAGGTTRRLTTTTSGTKHELTVYAMKPSTAYEITFQGPEGDATVEVTTAALPSSVAADLTATGTGSTPVLINLPCADEDTFAIVDTDGQVLWYQSYATPSSGSVDGGYHFTPDGTVLVSVGNDITETALDGSRLFHAERNADFPDNPLHHDVHRGANGLTYALFAEEVTEGATTYIMDGFFVFDDVGLVGEWHLRDHLTPSGGGGGGGGGPGGFWGTEFPGSTDWSHGNSITVDAAGDTWMSFRWLSMAARLDGDPTSPTFGELDWTMVGEASSPVAPGDFDVSTAIGGDSDFVGQHHVNPTPDGRLAMFDNREIGSSRGIVLEVDETARTAVIQESWEVGAICVAQGATYVLDSGNAIVTCATLGTVFEFAPGEPDPVWTLDLQCGAFAMVPRGIPAPI